MFYSRLVLSSLLHHGNQLAEINVFVAWRREQNRELKENISLKLSAQVENHHLQSCLGKSVFPQEVVISLRTPLDLISLALLEP